MDRSYLFGPVSRDFAEQHLWQHWPGHGCTVFDSNPGVDAVIGPEHSWESLLQSLPAERRPEFLVLYPQYRTIPPWLFTVRVPIVMLAGDANLLWHSYRQLATCCDLVLTDEATAERFRGTGIAHVRPAILFGGERSVLDAPSPEAMRDIDLLFVGNFQNCVQRARLPLLGQLAQLRQRWNVLFATNIYGEEYRRLLARSRIVFNRGIRAEWNSRVCEALAAGALLLQESDNREVFAHLEAGKECVAYTPESLLSVVEYYLVHEDERRQIAEAGRARVQEFSFGRFWRQQLEVIERDWEALAERAAERTRAGRGLTPVARSWQVYPATAAGDPGLAAELEALPASAERSSAVGCLEAVQHCNDWPRAAAAALPHFTDAWKADPTHVVAGLNLAEALLDLGRRTEAMAQARQTLAALDGMTDLSAAVLDAGHYRPEFDHFRVGWEQAAWDHAESPADEAGAKRRLLLWRLHIILGDLTDEVAHYEAAAHAWPDLVVSHAALGCALARHGRIADAVPHLLRAVQGNPFDRDAARALYEALGMAGRQADQAAFAQARRDLAAAAPQLIALEAWFAPPAPQFTASDTQAGPMAIVWEGDQCVLHSLSLVNRAFCAGLIERGHELSILSDSRVPGDALSVPTRLSECFHRPLSRPADAHIRQQWPPNFTPPASGHWVVMQPWEFGSLPRDWVTPLVEQVDEVWANTRYVRDLYVDSGVPAERVHVVPLGVRVEHFRPGRPPYPLKTAKTFRFLFVGGTIARKGIDLLLTAYARAFRRNDDVCLVIKDMGVGTFYRGQTADARIAELQGDPEAPEIEYLSQTLSDDELAGLYVACSCLVHPYRGEGFGLPIAEAMASGVPAIVTGLGAALDYCNADNALLIPARKQFFADRCVGDLETVGLPWLAEPDIDALTALLQYAASNRADVRHKSELAAAHIRRHFTWEQAVAAAEKRLHTLRDLPVRRLHRSAACAARTRTARVSLCMIARNEERFLAECLQSIHDLVDEIIVVDSGSTDRTKEIAVRFGAKVIDFTWVDSFSSARNESLKHATGEWILWLDADERLDAVNRTRLRTLLAGVGTENVAYIMRQQSTLEAGPHAQVHVDHPRLFRNLPGIGWRYRVHEQVLLSLREHGAQVQQTDIIVEHRGFAETALQGPKVDRNWRLLQLDLAEHPNDTFVLYNLGAVAMTQGRLAEALGYFQQCIDKSEPGDNLLPKVHALVTRCRQQEGRRDLALAHCRQARVAFPDDPELLFWEAMLLYEEGDLAGAEAALLQLLALPRRINFTSADSGLQGYRTRQFLAEICHGQGRTADAEAQLRQVLAECPDYPPALRMLSEHLFARSEWRELEQTLHRLRRSSQDAAHADLTQARMHLARREFGPARGVLEPCIASRPDALWPKIILSYVLLQEGADAGAAEAVLRDILVLDPTHQEARHNLTVLLSRKDATSASAPATSQQPTDTVERQRVSACIIAKNEEENLPNCLRSIADFVDELIVVDTGSTDRTKDIAASFGAKVFDFPWIDSFAAARNECLKHATGGWIFWMDADDRLDEENRAKLRTLFAGLRDENAAFVMSCRCLPDPVTQATTEVHHLRLFRNRPDVRWDFRVHEQILPAVLATDGDVRWSDIVIQHTGYQNPALRARKLERDLRLLLMEQAERPENPFILFNLGSVYQEQGRIIDALTHFLRSLAISAPKSSIVRKLYALIAQCQNHLGEPLEAVATCVQGRSIYPEDIEILFQEGIALRRLGEIHSAIARWEQALTTPHAEYFASINVGIRGYITRQNLAMAYQELGRTDKAQTHWRQALQECPGYGPAWNGLGDSYLAQAQWADLEALGIHIECQPGGKLAAALLRGRAMLACREFAAAQATFARLTEEYPTEVEPQLLLSHAYLQEGKDWDAAEKALLAVLALNPRHKEARHNLTVLYQQQGKPIDLAIQTPLDERDEAA
jgi:glycosyltransferase involved in cell wall biosynthesis/Flp pilus assembly protein TadD